MHISFKMRLSRGVDKQPLLQIFIQPQYQFEPLCWIWTKLMADKGCKMAVHFLSKLQNKLANFSPGTTILIYPNYCIFLDPL